MAKVITFSTKFPTYHVAAGEPTNFVEKFYASLLTTLNHSDIDPPTCLGITTFFGLTWPKHTTIRKGHRFKAGDYFSPRIWGEDINPKSNRSGPYHSKQIILHKDVRIRQVIDFKIENKKFYYSNILIENENVKKQIINSIAKNDGLMPKDFLSWFKNFEEDFEGQIIFWGAEFFAGQYDVVFK